MDSLMQKYSELGRLTSDYSEGGYTDSNNNEGHTVENRVDPSFEEESPPRLDKYSLRPRLSRKCQVLDDTAEIDKKTKKSTKQKSAPLSKYRRKTANARERNRMREINQAFETLRSIIPHGQVQEISGANEKLTKITTLRLAMRYIKALSAALNSGEAEENFFFDFDSYNDLGFLLESDGESMSLSEHSLIASPDFQEAGLCPFELGGSFSSLLQSGFTEHSLPSPELQDFFFT